MKRSCTDRSRPYRAGLHLAYKNGIDVRMGAARYPHLCEALDRPSASTADAAHPVHERNQCRARIIERMRLPRSGRVDRLARASSLADTLLNWTDCGSRFDGQRVTEIHCAVAADREVLLEGVRSARAVGQALQPQPLPVTGSDTSRMHGNGLPISIWRREIQSDWQHSAGGRQRLQPGRGGGSNGVLAVAEYPHEQGGHQARGAHSY